MRSSQSRLDVGQGCLLKGPTSGMLFSSSEYLLVNNPSVIALISIVRGNRRRVWEGEWQRKTHGERRV